MPSKPSDFSLGVTKTVLIESLALIFTVAFFLQIAPIEQLEPIRNIEPIVLWSGLLLLFVGGVFIVEFVRNLPDAGNHAGAKTGAYMFLVLSIITLLYGALTFSGVFNPFENAGSTDIPNFGLSILLGIVSIILYASIHPEIIHHKALAGSIKHSM